MPEPSVDPQAFRQLMARWATGVSVVTAQEGPTHYGLTVNAFLSISLHPPLLLVSLTHDADTTPAVVRSGRFEVHLLSAEQRAISERFASTASPSAKFEGLPVHHGPSGLLCLDGTLATFGCRVERTVDVSDHVLIIGAVDAFEAGRDGAPLLFFRSRYGEPDGPERVRLAPPASPGPPEPI
ncbi:MAG: flavin reductase family protein [Thermoplasmata archaeon]|nr:flavin reductase family protein [Thermoplasmata archaeon]